MGFKRPEVRILSPRPNKNPNFDTKRIEVRVLTLYPEKPVFPALLPCVGLKAKPDQVVCLVGFRRFRGLCGLPAASVIVESLVIVDLLG